MTRGEIKWLKSLKVEIGKSDKEWIKEIIKEWIFAILVALGFFGLYVVACLANGGVL